MLYNNEITCIRVLRALALVASLGVLAACGFKPLYGERMDSPAINDSLGTILVAPIPNRLGQLVRNAVLERIAPLGAPDAPAYRLEIKVDVEKTNVGIRQDESVTRITYRLNAEYRLRDFATEDTLVTGKAWSTTAYDVVRSDFATLVAEEDAQERLAEEVAEEIRTRLALYFAR